MKKVLGLAAAMLLIGSFAAAQDVSYNFDQQADFTKYKTYKWVEVKGGEQLDAITTKQITDAIEKQLAAKGLTKATGDAADMFVAYQVAVTQEKELQTWNTGYTMGPGRRRRSTSGRWRSTCTTPPARSSSGGDSPRSSSTRRPSPRSARRTWTRAWRSSSRTIRRRSRSRIRAPSAIGSRASASPTRRRRQARLPPVSPQAVHHCGCETYREGGLLVWR
jgi:hypothetical protein